MARSTEKLALRLMKTLDKEFKRQPDPIRARPVSELANKILKTQEEFDRVMVFLGPKGMRLINAWRGVDGKLVAQPNQDGLAWIASHKTPFTLQRLSLIVGIIVTILTFAWGVFVWRQR